MTRFYQQFATIPPPITSAQSGGGLLLRMPSLKFPDISNYKNTELYVYIAVAVLFVDLVVLFLVRYFPNFFGEPINEWYDKYKLGAVLSDVTIIMIGFFIAMFVYTEFIAPQQGWNLPIFLITLVVVQLVHDIFFYQAVIKPIPEGHNRMMDTFKRYAGSGGAKILVADAAMMLGAAGLVGLLKQYPFYITPMLGVLGLYITPYILETVPAFAKAAPPPPPKEEEEEYIRPGPQVPSGPMRPHVELKAQKIPQHESKHERPPRHLEPEPTISKAGAPMWSMMAD
jgi:hypothetical protein